MALSENLSGRSRRRVPVILAVLFVCFLPSVRGAAHLPRRAEQAPRRLEQASGRADRSGVRDIRLSAAARSIQPGELVLLTIDTSEPANLVRARAFGHDLLPFRVEPQQWRVLIGIDLDVTAGAYPVTVEAGSVGPTRRATYTLVVRSKRFPTRQLTVNAAFVNPPPNMAERITQEAREIEQLWRSASPERLWSGAFVRPVPDAANSAFGTRSIFNGQARSPHGGADFLSPAGTPVKAPNAGRVVLARELYFTGNTVIIDHGLGLFSMLAHLSATDVQTGDFVAAGGVIGRVGATGRVTGPHLHWAVRVSGARVDPLALLSILGT
jgi:murein DD-endopeptidase MepM/ murein hydrolase activator NlpD